MIYMGYILLINIKRVYKVMVKRCMCTYTTISTLYTRMKNGWKKKLGGKYR